MKQVGMIYDSLNKGKGTHGTHFAFLGLPDVEVILADPNPEPNLAIIEAKKHYLDYKQMIDNEDLDIVVICSRLPNEHLPMIKYAAERGIHILCEKPLTASLEEAEVICKLISDNNIKFAVAQLARYSKVFDTVKRLVTTGAIGTPLSFYARGKEDNRGGGEDMTVLGTHVMDIGNYIFGMPNSVFAEVWQEGRYIKQGDSIATTEDIGVVAGDNIFAYFSYPNQVKGFFESRANLFDKQTRMGITIVGTTGTISVRYDSKREVRLSRSIYPVEDCATYEVIELDPAPEIAGALPLDYDLITIPPLPWYFAESNRLAAWDLLCAIENNGETRCSATDAKSVLEMIFGIYRSAIDGQRVAFPLTNKENPLI